MTSAAMAAVKVVIICTSFTFRSPKALPSASEALLATFVIQPDDALSATSEALSAASEALQGAGGPPS